MSSQEQYDFVVIGAGAAGSVLADRLSESGEYSVCVIDAGGKDNHPFIHIPAGFVKTLSNPELMWSFESEPSSGSGMRAVRLPQGKVLGGSTSVNGLVYNRGQSEDFDTWQAMGNDGWGYQDVLPYFKKSESWQGPSTQARGSFGPMAISDPAWRDPLCESFIKSVASLGVPVNQDYNDGVQNGTGYYQRFINGRRRISASTAFLKNTRRRNHVEIKTYLQAKRIVTAGSRATHVECQRVNADGSARDERLTIAARHEIIVAAGTLNSPRLLQLSGIGSGQHLQDLGIPLIHELPSVGENFQDHYFVRCTARLKSGVVSLNQRAKGWSLLAQMIRWGFNKPNILTLSPSMAYAFVNAELSEGRPDFQFVFSPGSYKPGRMYELDDFPAITVGFTQQRPTSVGFVKIESTDFNGKLRIQPNYLATEIDQTYAVRGIRLCQRLFKQDELGDLVSEELLPGNGLSTDDELLQFARDNGNTGYHLVGTCRMGSESDKSTVVSPQLRVHGIDGLRVIDASVMPKVPSSNTCASTLMIAEKGADMILQSNR